MENGWIKLHRRVIDKGFYKKSQYVHLWVHLLLNVNHEPKEFMWNGNIILVKEGQMISGRKELSEQTGIPKSTIEDILKFLESQHQIQQQKTTKYRLITIVNWEKHQKSDKKSDNKPTTSRQQADTNKNVKKDKNEKNIHMSDLSDEFDRFWDNYPKKELKRRSQEIWSRKKLDVKIIGILEFIEKAKQTDRWKKGYVKQPPAFLNGECWNDDLTNYNDRNQQKIEVYKNKNDDILEKLSAKTIKSQ